MTSRPGRHPDGAFWLALAVLAGWAWLLAYTLPVR